MFFGQTASPTSQVNSFVTSLRVQVKVEEDPLWQMGYAEGSEAPSCEDGDS